LADNNIPTNLCYIGKSGRKQKLFISDKKGELLQNAADNVIGSKKKETNSVLLYNHFQFIEFGKFNLLCETYSFLGKRQFVVGQ
jgi:hypothetical protein